MTQKVLFSWSGGKDSALALHELTKGNKYEIAALLTTITEGYDRISMHGVRKSLLAEQAQSIGYPLEEVFIPKECTEEEYGKLMESVLMRYSAQGINAVVFGDLFLEDVRDYREEKLGLVGLKGMFPIWGRDTHEMARTFFKNNFRAVVTCVDTEMLDGMYVGREYDEAFILDLPENVDPCGENGEFHTFVYDGPIFREALKIVRGERVLREDRFYYCDVVSAR